VLRKVVILLLTIAAGSAAFIGTSLATGPRPPDVPQSLPAAALPTVTLSSDSIASISVLLTGDAAAQYGITSDSFTRVRHLADTALGPLYVLPGSSGLCVVLLPALSCGDPTTEHLVAVFVGDANGELVGGGVLAAGLQHVSISDGPGVRAIADPIPGGFAVTSQQHLPFVPKQPLSFSFS
jgi:hypothetical protein